MNKRYRLLTPKNKGGDELTNVRTYEKLAEKPDSRLVIAADQLDAPMELSSENRLVEVPRKIPKTGILVELRDDGTRIGYKLNPLKSNPLSIEDQDTYPTEAERKTLDYMVECLKPDSRFMHFMQNKGMNAHIGEPLRKALMGDSWQQITHSIAMFRPYANKNALDLISHMMNPEDQFTRAFREELVKNTDDRVLKRLDEQLNLEFDIISNGQFPNYPYPMFEDKEIARCFTSLKSWSKKNRLEASRAIFTHYGLISIFGKPSIEFGLPYLRHAMHDPDDRIRLNAISTLGFARCHSVVNELHKVYCDDPDPEVRGEAVNAIGLINDPAGFRTLALALRDNNPTIQTLAAENLGFMIEGMDDPVILRRWEETIIKQMQGVPMTDRLKKLMIKNLRELEYKQKKKED